MIITITTTMITIIIVTIITTSITRMGTSMIIMSTNMKTMRQRSSCLVPGGIGHDLYAVWHE
ncbi:hypothetical protein D3C78_1934730 [compost metagenome]